MDPKLTSAPNAQPQPQAQPRPAARQIWLWILLLLFVVMLPKPRLFSPGTLIDLRVEQGLAEMTLLLGPAIFLYFLVKRNVPAKLVLGLSIFLSFTNMSCSEDLGDRYRDNYPNVVKSQQGFGTAVGAVVGGLFGIIVAGVALGLRKEGDSTT